MKVIYVIQRTNEDFPGKQQKFCKTHLNKKYKIRMHVLSQRQNFRTTLIRKTFPKKFTSEKQNKKITKTNQLYASSNYLFISLTF